MKKYQTLLFDVDDTLLDFGAAEKLALRLLFKEYQIELTQQIEEHYKTINKRLWKSYEEGSLHRDEVINTRFSILLKEYGRDVDGTQLEDSYRKYLEQGYELIPGALELISKLQHQYELYIVTNGVSTTQDKRLRAAGLHPIFKGVFVSEDTGFQKPMKEFFDYVFARIPNFSPSQGLIIGDSLSADIQGGHSAGLDTCWFNPKGVANHTEIVPTYEIHHLEELFSILNAAI